MRRILHLKQLGILPKKIQVLTSLLREKTRLFGDAFLNDDEEADEEKDEIVVEESSEVDQYLLLPQLLEGMSFDLLAWWKNHSKMLHNLAKIA